MQRGKARGRGGGEGIAGGGGGGRRDGVISLEAAGHLSSSNVAAHLVVVRLAQRWHTAFEAQEKRKHEQYNSASRLAPLFCLTSRCRSIWIQETLRPAKWELSVLIGTGLEYI